MAIEIKADTQRLEDTLGATPQELRRALTAAGHRAGARFISYHRKTRMNAGGGVGIKATKGSANRPGFLTARVAGYEIHGDTIDNLTLEMRIRSGIAGLLERGGTLNAKRASVTTTPQFTVPFEALGRSGWAKARQLLKDTKLAYRARTEFNINLYRYGRVVRGKKKAFKTPKRIKEELFIVRTRSGRLFLGQRLPGAPKAWGAKRARLWFHLHPKVTYKPRLGFYDAWREFRPKATEILRQGVAFALQAARKKSNAKPT